MEGILVVAVCTKKEYMTVTLQEHPLADSCWVSVHTYSSAKNISLCLLVKNRNIFDKGLNHTLTVLPMVINIKIIIIIIAPNILPAFIY